MAAPYGVNLDLTDDGSFGWTFEIKMTDGTDYPWDSFQWEYEVKGTDNGLGFTLTDATGGGITVDEAQDTLTLFKAYPHGLQPGLYMHGLRAIGSGGVVIPFFDGQVTVTEGNLK